MAGRVGIVNFQALDSSDVFLAAEVMPTEYPELDEEFMGFNNHELEIERPWVTGLYNQKHIVDVDGDTRNLFCTYRADEPREYIMTVYVEYEEVETVPHEPILETPIHHDGELHT